MSILQDVAEMGVALAMAIGLFGALFVVPFAILWFTGRRARDAWRWARAHASDAHRSGRHVSRRHLALGGMVRSRRT